MAEISPFVEANYGWPYGSSGWNTDMDANLVKFSYLFDRNIDGIVATLPAISNGTAYFLTTDNRLYFDADGQRYSSVTPKWFIVTLKSSGQTYQFDGSALNAIDTPVITDTRLDAVELVVQGLSNSSDVAKGDALVAVKQPFTGAIAQTQHDVNKTKISVTDFTGADPTGIALSDGAFLAAEAAAQGAIYVPAGTFRLSTPMALGYKAEYFGPGILKFDNAEWWRRGGSAGVGVQEKYTLYYTYANQSDVTLTINGISQAFTWVDDFTILGPASTTSDEVKINIANGTLNLSAGVESPRSYNALGNGGRFVNPSLPDPITSPVGMMNTSYGSRALQNITEGENNTAYGSRALVSTTTGNNNTAVGFQAGYRASGDNNTIIGSIAGEWMTTGTDNTLMGLGAGSKITVGGFNTAIGSSAMGENQEGINNVVVGYRAGANSGSNFYDESVIIGTFSGDFAYGDKNTFSGYRAGCGPNGGSDGAENVFVGWFAGRNQDGADYNVGVGLNSLAALTSGQNNVSVGHGSASSITTASSNTAIGFEALKAATTSSQTAVGYHALTLNTSGTANTAIGNQVLGTNVTGSSNTAVGESALLLSTSDSNTAIGTRALGAQTTGSTNTAVGFESLRFTTTPTGSTAIGFRAGRAATTNGDQTVVGSDALRFEATGTGNTAIGRRALQLKQDTTNQDGFSNCTGLGMDAAVSASDQVQLGNSATTTYVYGTVQNRSDIRDKADVADTSLGLEFITSLRPVEGRWDMREDYVEIDDEGNVTRLEKDGSKKRQRLHQWFIAQEVKELCDKLGVDFGGYQDHSISGGCDVLSLGYDEFIPPIVKAIQELNSKMADMEIRLQALESTNN